MGLNDFGAQERDRNQREFADRVARGAEQARLRRGATQGRRASSADDASSSSSVGSALVGSALALVLAVGALGSWLALGGASRPALTAQSSEVEHDTVVGPTTSPQPTSTPAPKPTSTKRTPATRPPTVLVDVPDVVGLSSDEAIAQLKEAGFTVVCLGGKPCPLGDKVEGQNPKGGSQTEMGATITLTLASDLWPATSEPEPTPVEDSAAPTTAPTP